MHMQNQSCCGEWPVMLCGDPFLETLSSLQQEDSDKARNAESSYLLCVSLNYDYDAFIAYPLKKAGRVVLFCLAFLSFFLSKSQPQEPCVFLNLHLLLLNRCIWHPLNIMMNHHHSNRITGWVSRKTVPRFMERINFYSFPSAEF